MATAPHYRATTGTTPGRIVKGMKTAISLSDELLQQADKAARQMGLSRSRLFAVAIAEFLERQRQERMLHQLNEVYAGGMTPEEKRLLKQMKSKVRRVLERE